MKYNETRSLEELLQIILDNIEGLETGLCGLVGDLRRNGTLTTTEADVLLTHISYNRPSKFSSILAYINRYSCYYWPEGLKYPRKKWLKKQIKQVKAAATEF